MELEKGMLAISKAGHDKGCWYVVLNIEGTEAVLVNGKNRGIEKPKRKKRKHLQPVNEVPENLRKKLQKNEPWTNEEIKRAIKLCQKD